MDGGEAQPESEMTMIELTERDRDTIVSWVRNCQPEEGCGLLAGKVQDGRKTVHKVYPLENRDASPVHFSLDPRDQFEVLADARMHGWTGLGNFHSHPTTPARPSEEDLRLAFDREACYLIISLIHDVPEIRAFRLTDDGFVPEDIVIVDRTTMDQ